MIEVFTYSAKGKRESNEDYILTKNLSEGNAIYLLADGMGGYMHGDIASSSACNSISEYLIATQGEDDIPGSIASAVESANDIIRFQRKLLKTKLGTTIAGAMIIKNIAYFFWLGDVRIYQFRNSGIIFQSVDHSLVNDMKKNGIVSAMDLTRYKNIVTRSLMGDNIHDQIPIQVAEIFPEDTIIICSDGLWQNWDVGALLNLPETKLLNLLSENESSNDDNYSIIRIQQ